MAEKLSYGPRNAQYTSPAIQNEIINVMATMVRQEICTGVQQAGYFSILADETKDTSKQEQLSIAIRYFDCAASCLRERFLTFIIASKLTAEELSKYILDTLKAYNLDANMIVSQGNDGASVMSGHCNGVQQCIRKVVPQAIYIHCQAHCLNLVLVDCVKTNPYASEFFANLFTSFSPLVKLMLLTWKCKINFIHRSKPGNYRGCQIPDGPAGT